MPSRLTITQEVAALVGNAHKESGVLTIAEYVDLGVRDVEKVAPRHYRRILTGDGTDEYALASPWERGFSIVERVRWVAGADYNAKAVWLTQDQWELDYESDEDPQIRFSLSPSTSDRVVVEHTARHTLTDATATTTVNDTEASATARRAAVLLLRAAAASVNSRVPQGTDEDFAEPGIGSAAAEYRRLADDYQKEYESLLGIGADVPFVATYASTSANYNRRNESPLTHPRRSASWQG